jgi:raffinose/stachyose/melibiose transport system substrate-binding protein
MKLKSIMIIALIIILSIVTACGNNDSSNNTDETSQTTNDTQATTEESDTATEQASDVPTKPITLTYATFIGDGDKDMMGIVIKEFTKLYPNITFETQIFDHESYQEKLSIMSKSNTLPDLFWWNANAIVDAFTANQSIADLTAYIDDEFSAAMSQAALVNLTTPDGKVVGFPAENQVQAWLHNKALFDQYGVKIPETPDELKAAVKVFKENGIATIAQGTKDPWPTWGVQDWLVKHGIFDNAEKVFGTGEMKFSESPAAQVYTFIGELAALGAFPENNSTMTYEQSAALFTSGKAAMISIPSDQLAKVVGTPVEPDTSYTWGIKFPDQPFDQNRVPGGVTNGYAVSANAASDPDKMAAIVALNKFRFTEQGFKLSLKAGANLPATVQADLSEFGKIVQDQAKLIGDPNANIDLTAAYSYYHVWDKNWESYGSKFHTVDSALMNALIDGSKKTADIPAELAKIDKVIADVIKQWQADKK